MARFWAFHGMELGTVLTAQFGREFLLTNTTSFKRVASFRQFHLPGSVKSVKEPRCTALGVLYEILGDAVFDMKELATVQAFTAEELSVIQQMLVKKLNSPTTSSVGRLFDAVASIIDLRQRVNFEGQAAMELEFAVHKKVTTAAYDYRIEVIQSQLNSSGKPNLVVDYTREKCTSLTLCTTWSSNT